MTTTPCAIGTGLICLDAIQQPDTHRPWLATGGTSFNILAHLFMQGWHVHLYGHIGRDRAASHVLHDLETLGFPADGIEQSADICTPVYEQTMTPEGHVFLKHCPRCGKSFPRFTPMTREFTKQVLEKIPRAPDVAIIERASTPSLVIAREARERGALVYVELNRMDDPESTTELLGIADVFKVSGDRLHYFADCPVRKRVPVEIITRGDAGVHFRAGDQWFQQPGVPCPDMVDAAGAGDAFSASLISQWKTRGFPRHQPERLSNDIRLAQEAARTNCRHPGPRGAMYTRRRKIFGDDFCPNCASV